MDTIPMAIVESRNLCGNEHDAMMQAFHDEGINPTDDDKLKAIKQANEIWEAWKLEARG